MVSTSFISVRETLGTSNPWLAALNSSIALALGILVPMPTFCAITPYPIWEHRRIRNIFFMYKI
jgi:hypothetical protein